MKIDFLKNKKIFHCLDAAIFCLFGVALIFVLTNGIPLHQAGWIDFPKKVNYRGAVISLGALLLCLKFFADSQFQQTWFLKKISAFTEKQMIVGSLFLYGLYSGLYSYIGWIRHAGLQTRGFDLGIFAQAIWSTVHGRFLFSSIKDNICLLGDHVSPILLLTVPFYAIWQDPRMLLLLQAVAAGAFIFPLTYFAYQKSKDPWVAFLFSVAFFFYLPTRSALHEDFHPEILIEPIIFLAFLALEAGWWKRFAVLAVLIMSAKENMCGVVFILGFYAAFLKKEKVIGLFWMALSIGIFLFEMRVLVPMLNHGDYFYDANFKQLLSPAGFIQHVFGIETFKYLLTVFFPFLFLPFFHLPTFILTLPILLQNILSSNDLMRSMKYHYMAGMTAFLFIATLMAFEKLVARYPWFKTHARFWAAAILFAVILRSGPSEYYNIWNIKKHVHPLADVIRDKLRAIPSEYVVLSHNDLVAQMTNRMFLYQFHQGSPETKLQQAQKRNADYAILDQSSWEGPQSFETDVGEFKNNGYLSEFETTGFVIFRHTRVRHEKA